MVENTDSIGGAFLARPQISQGKAQGGSRAHVVPSYEKYTIRQNLCIIITSLELVDAFPGCLL